ncbi:PfkB family carbohydrate kinase [Pseudonocardia saturnea]
MLAPLELGPVLTPNRSECLDLAARLGLRTADVTGAAHRIQDRTGAPVVVTLGGEGALVSLPDADPVTVPPRPARVRDTSGAGDTVNGVLAARPAGGAALEDAVRTAVVASSLSESRVGARAGMPTAAEITAAEVVARE